MTEFIEGVVEIWGSVSLSPHEMGETVGLFALISVPIVAVVMLVVIMAKAHIAIRERIVRRRSRKTSRPATRPRGR